MMAEFPLMKLGVLAFRQLSKPISDAIKNRAKDSRFFRHYIAMPPAQIYNWVEVKTRMWALNLGKASSIPPLNEKMAIELGASLLGELTIFTIGATLLISEYIRQSNIERKKEETILLEKIEMINTINELSLQIERQDAKLRKITRVIAECESRKGIMHKWI